MVSVASMRVPAASASGRVHTIHLGEYAAHRGGVEIRTLLGSCVCVCLWDPVLRIGGANHFQLPDTRSDHACARYGVHAMELLINRMLALGGDRRRFLALAFGGGAVIPALTRHHVGQRNAEFAKRFLETEGIPLRGGDLGGTTPRQVRFDTATGTGSCRRLGTTEARRIAVVEVSRWQNSRRAAVAEAGDVELF